MDDRYIKELLSSGVLQSELGGAVKKYKDQVDFALHALATQDKENADDAIDSANSTLEFVGYVQNKLTTAMLCDAIDDAKINTNRDAAIVELKRKRLEIRLFSVSIDEDVREKYLELMHAENART